MVGKWVYEADILSISPLSEQIHLKQVNSWFLQKSSISIPRERKKSKCRVRAGFDYGVVHHDFPRAAVTRNVILKRVTLGMGITVALARIRLRMRL